MRLASTVATASAIAVIAALAGSVAGCSGATDASSAASPEHADAPELAVLMGTMQRFSQKLGYAVQAKNQRLAEFYLHEIEETLEEIAADIPVHDGLEVPPLLESIVRPELDALDAAVDEEAWEKATPAYATLIASCNRCHAAMQHEFIKITVPSGPPPFNQSFSK